MSDDQIRRVVVTGAAGFIGSHVTCHLASLGFEVTAVDAAPGWRSHLRSAVDSGLVRFVATPSPWPYDLPARAADGADAVVHLAYAEPRSGRSEVRQEVCDNLVGTLDLLDALPPSVMNVVFASTALVYGRGRVGLLAEHQQPEPDSAYALAKVGVEQSLAEWVGLDRRAAALRFSTVYGPAETVPRAIPNFIRALLAGDTPVVAVADDSRDYIHARDVARAVGLATMRDGSGFEAINVGTGIRTTTEQVAHLCATAVGVSIEPQCLAPKRPPVELVVDPSKARTVLGFTPAIELPGGLSTEVDWFRTFGDRAPAERDSVSAC